MIFDAQNLFSDAQAITAAAASTNIIDLGSARNIGVGENLFVVVTIDTTFADTGSNSTLTVALEGDSSDSFTPDGIQQLFIIPALAVAGSKYVARISPDFASNYRYIRLYYTPNNGDLSAGAVTAFICHDADLQKHYPKGYTIS